MNKTSSHPLKLLQINLNDSYSATEILKNNIPQIENQITCIQEPYYRRDRLIGFAVKDAYRETINLEWQLSCTTKHLISM